MTVEVATKVEDLNASYPASGDSKSEGDDHIRLIKSTLLYTLAGASSTGVTGFNVATQATANVSTLAASTALVDAKITAAVATATIPGGTDGQVLTKVSGVPAWETPNSTGANLYLAANFGAL